jgi:predicted RNA-binding Zn-ribbon protein involved in translation (DUF1610 family)
MQFKKIKVNKWEKMPKCPECGTVANADIEARRQGIFNKYFCNTMGCRITAFWKN